MSEPVRLVIWDLDQTFWSGTLTEGGIREYVQAHHDIVIELSRRGILNSICSKNDLAQVQPILEEHGIFEYFIFPSINWEPKGPRLAQLVEQVQLRPQTILFIDDHPGNRAEAAAAVPGIQVESEEFLAKLLDDPRFVGKDDPELKRLKQYKLLEARSVDAAKTSGDNDSFLRSCNIRVLVDYDVHTHIDRAIELINRTNQLNFTKLRLPDDVTAARLELLRQVAAFDCVAGLIKVADNYGDYGYVGFFLMQGMRETPVPGASGGRLVHFCFSCRTLGMRIEQWTYEHLGRPELIVAGEVLTDLAEPHDIDWVTQVTSMADATSVQEPIADRILVYGGCEAQVLSVYLSQYAKALTIFGNYVANGVFARISMADIALDICTRKGPLFEAEVATLGLPLELESADFFAEPAVPTVYVFNFGADAQGCGRIRHKQHGWRFSLDVANAPGINLVGLPEQQVLEHLRKYEAAHTPAQRDHLLKVTRHLREHYEEVVQPPASDLARTLVALIERVPPGSKLIFVVPHDEWRPHYPDVTVERKPSIGKYRALVRSIARNYPFVGVANVADLIRSPDDLKEDDHYVREVYLGLAQRIAALSRELAPRTTAEAVHAPPPPMPSDSLTAHLLLNGSPLDELADGNTVDALFETILGRKINNDPWKEQVHYEYTLRWWIQALLGSEEYAAKIRRQFAEQARPVDG